MSRGSVVVFLLLLGVHLGAVAALLQASPTLPTPETKIEPAKLQGMLLAAQPDIAPQPKAEPKPAPQPLKERPKQQPKLATTSQKPARPKAITAPPVAKAAAAAPAPAATQQASRPIAASAKVNTTGTATRLPSADAAGLNNQAPSYPLLSRKRKEQGTVWLLLLVSKDGKVTELKLQKTSGYARLDQAALQTVKHWTFQPALQQGQPVDYWYELPVKFSLQQG